MAKKNVFCWRNIIIVILLTPIISYVIWRETVSYQLKSIKEEMRAAGNPVTFEDLANIAAENNDKTNAINYIMEASSLEEWPTKPIAGGMGMPGMGMGVPATTVSTATPEEKKPPVYGYMPMDFFNLNEEDKQNLDIYLKANKTQLEALNNAIKIGWYAERINWQDGEDGIWEGLSELKHVTSLVKYQAISYVNNNKIDEAVNLLNSWYDMIQQSNQNRPYTLIQALVSISCRYLLDDTVRWMLRENSLTNEQLTRLYEQIKPIDHITILPQILQTEAVFALSCLTDYQNYNISYSSVQPAEAKIYGYSGLAKLNAIKHSEAIEKYIAASQYDYYHMKKEYETIGQEIEKLGKIIYKPIKDVFPAMDRVTFLIGKSTATQEILKIILANEMYKNEKGNYAESLEVLKQYKPDLDINDMFTASDQFGYRTITTDNKILEYFTWSKTDKTDSDIKDVIDKMIADDLNSTNDLSDDFDNDFIIYRIKSK